MRPVGRGPSAGLPGRPTSGGTGEKGRGRRGARPPAGMGRGRGRAERAAEEEKRETEGHSGQKHERKRERVFSFSFISNVFQIHFQLHLNHFEFWSIPLTSINQMHQHICTTMLLHPIMNFNLIKNIIYL